MSGTESKESAAVAAGSARPLRSALLRKQPEIEEVDEEDTSPDSDQSSTTITAGTEAAPVTELSESGSPEDDLKTSPASQKYNHISPKLKQLTRSEALCEECASPPLDPLKSTASSCSSDSSSSGIGTKSSFTSGSISGSSLHGRLEKDGSQSSEAGTSSSLSRDSSVDTPYKDSTGIDLEDFIKKTLNKTPKDRSMLIKLEVDLIKFIREPKHHYLKFPQMSSYDRMLVHRIAAFFGLDHNVDQTGKCVIVNKTANTRIPNFSFQEHISNGDDPKPKKLLTRGGGSFDELTSRSLQKPSLDNTRAKSLEERKQVYEEVRSRIFTGEEQGEAQPTGFCQEDPKITGIVKKLERPVTLGTKDENLWSSCESSGYGSIDNTGKVTRILVPKANSFGGTGTFIVKSPMRGGSLNKADSMSMGVGMIQPSYSSLGRPIMMSSPSCSQSESSSLCGSSSGLAPSPQQQGTAGQKVYWVASDLNSIPPGSVVINPQTGLPYTNPDGTPYKYMPGQPLPQAGSPYPQQSPTGQLYQVQQEWGSQPSQEMQTSKEICQQLSVMRLTPQSSFESTGAGGDNPVGQQAAQQPVIVNQNIPQYNPQQAHAHQGVYYTGPPAGPGQQPVRFVCSYSVHPSASQAQGFTPVQTVPLEASSPQFTRVRQYCPQFITDYQGNQLYQMTPQGHTLGGAQGQTEVNYQCGYTVTSQVEGQTCAGSNGYSYPGQFSQQQTVVAPNQAHVFYTIPNQQSNQHVQQCFVYNGQQGSTYQSNTPPSQNTSVTPNVQLNSSAIQPHNGLNTVNTISMAAQPTPGVVQGSGVMTGVVPATSSTQYISSYQTSHPMMHPGPHFHPSAQTFSSPVRPVAPQMVPVQTIPVHGQLTSPQTFHPVYRPSMQMPMQIPAGYTAVQQQQQQQQMHPSASVLVAGLSKSPQQVSAQHVTVSAKGLSLEAAGRVGQGESGDSEGCDTGDVQLANSSMHRPHAPAPGEMSVQYQPLRPQVPPVQFPQQPQPLSNRSSPNAPKPQRTKKLRSRDHQTSSQSSESDSGSGQVTSSVLEVCDLPPLSQRSDFELVMRDLITLDADIQFSVREKSVHLHDINSQNQAILTLNKRTFAVFVDSASALQTLKSHCSSNYKLKRVENIPGLQEYERK